MTMISPVRDPEPRAPGETPICTYCKRPIARVDLIADRPYPQVGPSCSDYCSVRRRLNTPEWGGA